MRSSGRTTVSRTSERIDSLRRSRRGRRVSGARTAVVAGSSLVGLMLFVVIVTVSIEEGFGAGGGAEAAAQGAVGAVGTEVAPADHTALEAGHFFRVAARDAFALEGGHGSIGGSDWSRTSDLALMRRPL